MAQLLINIGESVNDKRGDPLRTAFDKVNQNFTELFTTDTSTKYHLGDDVQFVDIDPDSGMVVIQSGFDTSMPVYIKGANCSDEGVGGDVYIEAGGAPLPNNGTTGVVGIAGREVTIEVDGGTTTFASNGSAPYVTFPAVGDAQLAIQGGEIFAMPGTGGLALTSYDGNVLLSTHGNIAPALVWEFDRSGTLTTPILFPVSFTAVLDVEHRTVGTGTYTGPAWEFNLEWSVAPNGEIGLMGDNGPLPSLVAGYADDQTFEFTEADHGIPGYTLTIVLSNVVYAGPAGWTANLNFSEPPVYPSTINSQGAIKLTSNENSLILGTDGGVTISGRLTLLDNPAPGKGIYGTNGLSLYAKNGDQLGLYWNADDATNPYEGIPYHNARVVATVSDWSGYNIEIVDSDAYNKIWTFQPNGVLALPVGGDIVDSNGDSVLGGGGAADRLVAGDKSVILDTNGDLTLPTGGEIKSAAGTGDVVIEANNGSARTWTFDGTGTLSLPSAIDNASIYHVGSIGIKTDGLSGGQQWTYDDTGKLTFPDTHLTIENSTIGRKVVTIFDDGIVHTEDAEGSRLVFTDTSTRLETYSDPDGVNNTMMARHYTNGAATAGLEVYTEVVSGRTGTSLEVTGSGVAITSGDGVVDNTWNFDIGGDLVVPGKIKRNGSVAEIDLGVTSTDNVLLKTTDEAGETQLLLSALAGASLTSNHNILVSAGNGATLTYNIYLEAEALWELVRDEDASIIVPATRPWAGMPSYLAYTEIMLYPGSPPGVLPVSANMAPVAKTASDAYTAWQEELASTNVSVSVAGNEWLFGADGRLTVPGAIFKDGSLYMNSSGSTTTASVIAFGDSGSVILRTSDQSGNHDLVFDVDGDLTVPGALYVTNGLDGAIIGTNGVRIIANHANPLSLEWNLSGEENIYSGNPALNTDNARIEFGINGFNVVVNNPTSGGSWTFGPDSKLTLPNSAKIQPSTTNGLYIARLAGWETLRADLAAQAAGPGITAEGWPFIAWNVNGTNAVGYLTTLQEAWNAQQTGGTLIFVPAITSDMYQQLRNAVQLVESSYATVAGSVDIVAGTKTWTVGADGGLLFPSGNRIYDDTGDRLIIDGSNGDGYVEINGTANILIGYNSPANVVLGNTATADSRVDIMSNKLRIINTDVPEHSTGAAGDMVGMVAFSSDYIYYCKQNYSDGLSDIWVRSAWTSTSW